MQSLTEPHLRSNFPLIFVHQNQVRSIASIEPQCASRARPPMTSLFCGGEERETLPTLVTWVTLACALNDAVSTRNVTWPSNRRRTVSWSVVSVKSRARHPLPLMTYSVHGCRLSKGTYQTVTKVGSALMLF